MPFELTRRQLYDLVWSEPMHRLAKHIGISDVAIAKHCRRIGVPVPGRGYWNKLQAGHRVRRTALPEHDLTTIRRVGMQGALSPELRARIKGEPGVDEGGDEAIDILTERLRKRLGKVTVPRDFARTHALIAGLLQKDEAYRQKALTDPYSWPKPQFDTPCERRRLLFLNGLFLGFQSIGASPWVRGERARELGISMGDASVSFELDRVGARLNRQHRVGPVSNKREKLRLTVTGRAPPNVCVEWQDQDDRPIERQLSEIIIGMAVAGEHRHRQWLEQKAAWERERREEAERAARRRQEDDERRERERLAAIEKAKLDGLLQGAQAWRAANDLRDYIKAVHTAAGERTQSEAFQAWSRWALAEADKLDPITSGDAVTAASAHEPPQSAPPATEEE